MYSLLPICRSALFACLIVTFGAGLSWSRGDKHGDIHILKSAGCRAEYYLVEDLATGYMFDKGGLIKAQSCGNKIGIKLLAADAIDFAFLSSSPKKLAKKLKIDPAVSSQWQIFRIARSPIVTLVNRENPISNLSLQQLTAIFKGEITNWQQVGGADLPIQVVSYAQNVESGILMDFKNTTVGMMGKLSPTAIKLPAPKKAGVYTALNKEAIAFMGQNLYRERYGKVITVNGKQANKENILNASYPLAATYYLVFDIKNRDKLSPFLQYVQSEKGKTIINEEFLADFKQE